MNKYRILLIITLLSLAGYNVEAQRFNRRVTEGFITVGAQVGTINYFGDMNPLTQYVAPEWRFLRPSIAINVQRKLSSNFHVRLEFTYGRLRGDDFISASPNSERHRYRYMRNTHFRNDIKELSLVGEYNIIGSSGKYYRRANFTPYILGGVAVFHHNPKAKTSDEFGGKWVALQPLGTEGQQSGVEGYAKPYARIQPALIFGAGVKWKLNDRTNLSFELAFRYLFFDQIDDVSGTYPDMGDLQNDLVRSLSNRTLETNNAVTGRSREPDLSRILEQVSPRVTYVGSDGNPYNTIAGFGSKGDKRGEAGNNDIYLVAGIRLSYIINVGLKCPQFR
ncbi:DUF6089 family protein [uncultured Microscilla sp.]|uniref:DUF6089 family protein n=1 Tax=uncultured Microscilla sp. TaxID=432653 RepID=UPI00263248C0|nr:DUF6089 family protein [uncultured Microscilla sp.]